MNELTKKRFEDLYDEYNKLQKTMLENMDHVGAGGSLRLELYQKILHLMKDKASLIMSFEDMSTPSYGGFGKLGGSNESFDDPFDLGIDETPESIRHNLGLDS